MKLPINPSLLLVAVFRPSFSFGSEKFNIAQSSFYLGLTDQTRNNLVSRCKSHHKASRFPVFWGPNYGWIPDQDHGGVMMKAVQAMLLQPDPYSREVYLKPALPKDWNCSFKLHAPYQTILEGEIVNDQIKSLKVTPESRRNDAIIVK